MWNYELVWKKYKSHDTAPFRNYISDESVAGIVSGITVFCIACGSSILYVFLLWYRCCSCCGTNHFSLCCYEFKHRDQNRLRHHAAVAGTDNYHIVFYGKYFYICYRFDFNRRAVSYSYIYVLSKNGMVWQINVVFVYELYSIECKGQKHCCLRILFRLRIYGNHKIQKYQCSSILLYLKFLSYF